MTLENKRILTFPRQTIDTKTHLHEDVIGWCPLCEIETVISCYSILGNKIQECCRTCGKWWDIHEARLLR
jgi:hypothetical protein